MQSVHKPKSRSQAALPMNYDTSQVHREYDGTTGKLVPNDPSRFGFYRRNSVALAPNGQTPYFMTYGNVLVQKELENRVPAVHPIESYPLPNTEDINIVAP